MIPRGLSRPAAAVLLILLVGGCENSSSSSVASRPTIGYELVDIRDVTIAPQVTYKVAPALPIGMPQAGRRRITSGEAVVDLVVDETGQAQMVRAIRASSPDFADAAVAAVSQWRFSPGQKDGRVVQTRLQIPIKFTEGDSDM